MPFEFDLIIRVIVFLINFFGFWLIFWVYFQSQDSKVKKWFTFLVFSSLVWTDFAYLARVAGAQNLDWSLIFTKMTWSAVPLFFISFYFFVSYLLKFRRSKRRAVLSSIVLVVGITCWFFVVFTDFVVKDVIFENGSYYRYILGKGMEPFLLAVLFYMMLGLILLFKSYIKISKERKLQVQYLIFGISILYVMNIIFNVFLPVFKGVTQYYQFGDYSNFVFLSLTAYAITKRKLFGMRIVLTTILVGLISAFLLMDVLIFSEDFLMRLWKMLILTIFIYFGYLLIRSVLIEIKNREEIERLSKAKSEFISIASHQLRTPLTAIKGYISMILEGTYGKISPKVKEPMRKVYISNERLINLVNNLLSISRIESGKMGMSLEKTSVEELISNIVDMFVIEAEKKGISLKFEKPKNPLPNILIDKDKITDVVSNVVSNCIKYTENGGVNIKIKKLSSQSEHGKKIILPRLRIVISDTGEGMTKMELSKVFQSFSRGMAGTKLYTEGAGLGLYVAKKYIEMHEGRVWATSEGKSKGSTFYIELPIK